MRREVLKAAVAQVGIDLVDSGMKEMFDQGFEMIQRGPDRAGAIWVSIAAVAKYARLVSLYNDAERQILEIFDISSLGEAETWQSQINDINAGFVFSHHTKINQVVTFLPKVVSLLNRQYSVSESNIDNSEHDTIVESIVLTDEHGSLSSPARIIELLSAVQQIYLTIAEANGVSDAKLAVVGLDSGSEKSIDFLGIARFMHELRESLQTIYNIVAFHKQNVTLKNLQVAGDTLSVVGKIAKLEKDKAINADEAQRLRHSLFGGLEKFAATGAYTRSMNTPAAPPALAMRPSPRLLTGPVDELVRDANSTPETNEEEISPISAGEPSLHSFSDEEIAIAVQALKSARTSASETERVDQPAHKVRTPRPKKRPIKETGDT